MPQYLISQILTLPYGKAALRGEVGEGKKEQEASCCHQSHMFRGQPWQLGTINYQLLDAYDNLQGGAKCNTYLLVD